jgi:hypothetical protein
MSSNYERNQQMQREAMKPKFRILELPAEVRNMIYENDLQDRREVTSRSEMKGRPLFVFRRPPVLAPLMQLNRQVRQEYGSMFLRDAIIRIDITHVVDFLETFYAKRPGSVDPADDATLPLELHLHSVGDARGVLHIDLHALMKRMIQMPTPHIHFAHEAVITRVIAPLVDRSNAVWCEQIRNHVKSAKMSFYKSSIFTLPHVWVVEIEHDQVQVREHASMVGHSQLLTGMGLAGIIPPTTPTLAPWTNWTSFMTLTFCPVGTSNLSQQMTNHLGGNGLFRQ